MQGLAGRGRGGRRGRNDIEIDANMIPNKNGHRHLKLVTATLKQTKERSSASGHLAGLFTR